MEERKINIILGGISFEVFAGNAALSRYRKAGGSMKDIEGIDANGENTFDSMMDAMDALALLIHSNLVEGKGLSVEDIINGSGEMTDLFKTAEELFSGVPWLGNVAAAGKDPK
tara:strand:- start:526 stop:864 length:339 start_codon:yes stop_codon:yes gene_type:complete